MVVVYKAEVYQMNIPISVFSRYLVKDADTGTNWDGLYEAWSACVPLLLNSGGCEVALLCDRAPASSVDRLGESKVFALRTKEN